MAELDHAAAGVSTALNAAKQAALSRHAKAKGQSAVPSSWCSTASTEVQSFDNVTCVSSSGTSIFISAGTSSFNSELSSRLSCSSSCTSFSSNGSRLHNWMSSHTPYSPPAYSATPAEHAFARSSMDHIHMCLPGATIAEDDGSDEPCTSHAPCSEAAMQPAHAPVPVQAGTGPLSTGPGSGALPSRAPGRGSGAGLSPYGLLQQAELHSLQLPSSSSSSSSSARWHQAGLQAAASPHAGPLATSQHATPHLHHGWSAAANVPSPPGPSPFSSGSLHLRSGAHAVPGHQRPPGSAAGGTPVQPGSPGGASRRFAPMTTPAGFQRQQSSSRQAGTSS